MKNHKGVLVIESDHDTRVKVRQALEKEGYLVNSVTNVTNAFDLLRKNSAKGTTKTVLIGLIIFGMSLPFMESSEFLNATSGDPLVSSIPVVIVAENDEKVATSVAGVLRRPLQISKLVTLVRGILSPEI
jgi:DNA-binding response OmpR family regulator